LDAGLLEVAIVLRLAAEARRQLSRGRQQRARLVRLVNVGGTAGERGRGGQQGDEGKRNGPGRET
jgi:hypothetical protein